MKKILIFILTINSAIYSSQEKPQEDCNLVKKGLVIAGVVGGCGLCVLAKRNWSSVAWATKELLKEQMAKINIKLDIIATDVSVIKVDTSAIRRDVLENSRHLQEVQTSLGSAASKKDLEKLQTTVDQIKRDTTKILEILEKNN